MLLQVVRFHSFLWLSNILLYMYHSQTPRLREQTGGGQMGVGLGDWEKEGKALRTTNWRVPNSHRDTKHSIGDIVNTI